MRTPRLLRIITVCLSISACGAVTDAAGGFPEDVRGGWVLVDGGGPEGAVRGVAGERVTLTVEESGIGASVGCNSFGGTATVTGDRVRVDQMGGTEMGCAEPLMTMEQAYTAALREIDHWELADDRLVLTGAGTRLTYERRPEVDAVALYGTTWVLDSLIEGDAVSTVAGEPATLELSEDGTLVGSTGCRTLTGEFILVSDSLNLTSFAADGDCPPDLARQDGLVIEVLGDGVVPTVEGDRLTMTDGPKGLVYRPGS